MNKITTLAQICDALSDGLHKAPIFNPNGEYLFVNATNLENGHIVDKGEGKRADFSEFQKYGIELNDRTILYSIDGTIGNIAKYRGEKVILGKGACYLMVNESVDPDFIYFLLQSEAFNGYIRKMSTGSTIHHISLETMRNFKFSLPDYEDQKRISSVLMALENKIHHNTRLTAELESMAKTIYDYWFAQFDFPDADGKPYRSSGGAMEWNEQLKRKIPRGWSAGTVSGLMKIENTSVDPKKLGNTVMEHYSIPAFDVDHCPAYEEANTIESSKYAVDPECILTSKLNPHFKRLWDPYCDTENAICSTEFIVYRPIISWMRPFCYAVLNSDAFYVHMSSKATASTGSRKRIQPDVSASFELPVPDERTMRSFVELYGPIMEKQKALYKENRELTKLRDWLLPMLMNGQAIVK